MQIIRAESRGEVIYAFDCGRKYALVDVGSEDQLEAKLHQLKAKDIALDRIAAVLITHFHGDHCGALAKLHTLCSPKVVTHRYSVEAMTETPPIPRELVDITVEDGDTVQIGEAELIAHHLPGHTHDSVAYQLGDDFFVGDISFEWAGIGWMDVHWGSCVPQYRESLQRLLDLHPARIYPGHGEPAHFTQGMLNRALTNLDLLEKIDGSPIVIGRPTPLRAKEEGRRVIRVV